MSQAVVLAEAAGSATELRGKIPYTLTTFQVLQRVAGQQVDARPRQRRPGARWEDRLRRAGTPALPGRRRYLLFLDPAPTGNWRLRMSSYGILQEEAGTGLLRPVREAAQLEVISRQGVEGIGVYRESALLQHIATAAGAPWHREAVEATPTELVIAGAASQTAAGDSLQAGGGTALASAPPVCQFVTSPTQGVPLRWFDFETTASTSLWHTTPGQLGISDGGVAAVQQGISAWVSHDAWIVKETYAGLQGFHLELRRRR